MAVVVECQAPDVVQRPTGTSALPSTYAPRGDRRVLRPSLGVRLIVGALDAMHGSDSAANYASTDTVRSTCAASATSPDSVACARASSGVMPFVNSRHAVS